MANNPVNWFEIYVQDIERAKAFYEAVLDVTMASISPPDEELSMYSFPMSTDSFGSSGAIVHHEMVPSGGNSTLVYFHCNDCAVEETRIATAGGKLERAKMSIGDYGFISLATDPDGNRFGLHSMQ